MRLAFLGEPEFEPVRATKNRAYVPGGALSAKAAGTRKTATKKPAPKGPTLSQQSEKQSKSRSIPPTLLFFMAVLLISGSALGQAVRLVQGAVRNMDEQPLPNAVVYLQDQKSQEVRTYIVQADGRYRFGQMSPDVDYQLWAEFKGHKSKTRSISSFDSKKEFAFDLKIDTSK